MKLKVRHVYDFGPDRRLVGDSLTAPAAWDAIRETGSPFGLPTDQHDWELLSATPEMVARADAIVDVAQQSGARSIASYGVGTGALERAVQRAAPELRLICADYAPRTVERLRALFPVADVVEADLRSATPLPADLHLMHRLDAELDDDEWQRVFAGFEQPILFVPNLLLGPARAVIEIARRLVKPSMTHAGWYRSEGALRSLWTPTHDDRRIDLAGTPAFRLTRR